MKFYFVDVGTRVLLATSMLILLSAKVLPYRIGHYNPSVRITTYLLTRLMLCVLILYVSGGTYSLTSTLNDRFLKNFLMAGLFYSQGFCQKSAEKKAPNLVYTHQGF